MQALTFASLADPKYGSMAIEYQQVPCSPPGKMVAHVTDNRGEGGWARFGIEVCTLHRTLQITPACLWRLAQTHSCNPALKAC